MATEQTALPNTSESPVSGASREHSQDPSSSRPSDTAAPCQPPAPANALFGALAHKNTTSGAVFGQMTLGEIGPKKTVNGGFFGGTGQPLAKPEPGTNVFGATKMATMGSPRRTATKRFGMFGAGTTQQQPSTNVFGGGDDGVESGGHCGCWG